MSRFYINQKDKRRRAFSSRLEYRRHILKLHFFRTQNFRQRTVLLRSVANFTPNASFSRVQNRCLVTNNARAVYRRFHLSRHTIKKFAAQRKLAGVYRKL